jgi:hypothetical protein
LGYKVENKLLIYLGLREQKRLNTTDLAHSLLSILTAILAPEGMNILRDMDVNGRVISKWFLKK